MHILLPASSRGKEKKKPCSSVNIGWKRSGYKFAKQTAVFVMAASEIACGENALTSISAALEVRREKKRKSYRGVDAVVCQGVRR